MREYLEELCDGIDAAVFSGDVLYSDDERKELAEYIARWSNAIGEHEAIASAEQAQQGEPVPRDVLGDDLPDAVIQATAEALGDAYDCMRVWSAWGVGTMGPDDFLPVADDGDRVAEIARAAITAWRSSAIMTAVPQQNNRECGCGWRGAVEDCAWLGSVGPLCPNCHETTEDAAQPPAGAVPLALPEWMECDAKVQAGTANALERFIYANEPAGDSAAEFRAGLLSMLAAAQKGGA